MQKVTGTVDGKIVDVTFIRETLYVKHTLYFDRSIERELNSA
jgi:hypothetical protein